MLEGGTEAARLPLQKGGCLSTGFHQTPGCWVGAEMNTGCTKVLKTDFAGGCTTMKVNLLEVFEGYCDGCIFKVLFFLIY